MSQNQKITSKNLSYNSSLPPFLANLHAQAGGSGGGRGDPSPGVGQRRAAKKRSASEEADDAPIVVDEDGNVVSVEVDKEGAVVDKGATPDVDDDAEKRPRQEGDVEKAAIGGRKRKVGRVVGEAAEEDAAVGPEKGSDGRKGNGDDKPRETDAAKEKKPKKKAKKIKLSFDEEEG